jgi:hypothetical protein
MKYIRAILLGTSLGLFLSKKIDLSLLLLLIHSYVLHFESLTGDINEK